MCFKLDAVLSSNIVLWLCSYDAIKLDISESFPQHSHLLYQNKNLNKIAQYSLHCHIFVLHLHSMDWIFLTQGQETVIPVVSCGDTIWQINTYVHNYVAHCSCHWAIFVKLECFKYLIPEQKNAQHYLYTVECNYVCHICLMLHVFPCSLTLMKHILSTPLSSHCPRCNWILKYHFQVPYINYFRPFFHFSKS